MSLPDRENLLDNNYLFLGIDLEKSCDKRGDRQGIGIIVRLCPSIDTRI